MPGGEGPCGGVLEIFNPLEFGLGAVGTDTTLDVVTWNLEFFPLDLPGDFSCPHPIDSRRPAALADLVNRLQLDLIAVQEISDPSGFQDLLDLCPNYDGVLSPEVRGCNYQRPGLLYRKDQVTVNDSRLIFTNNTYAFPRSPLEVDVTVRSNGRSYRLNVIVVHLKASGDAESQDRRRAASHLLKTYLDDRAAADSTVNYMIAGDWNDVLDEPLAVSSFPSFLEELDDYNFVNFALAGRREFVSLPGSNGRGALIDHILVNRAACPEFIDGRVTTLRLDEIVPGYDNISDHLPVMVQTPVFR